MSHLAITVGSIVRRATKRGRPTSATLGIVVEVTDRLARVRSGKGQGTTTTWPLALLEVVTLEQESKS